ncbi:hypothetical protein B0H14DRAFT_3889801 [Mycena olivaceomarginata]|nr:hypothetical protein B0H14DRAFT_3889801 [Mycena olivaceomarginata]
MWGPDVSHRPQEPNNATTHPPPAREQRHDTTENKPFGVIPVYTRARSLLPAVAGRDASPIERLEPRPERPYSPVAPPSVFSNDIWLGDNCGESAAFAREVQISGWTSVGDAHGLGGASVVYDCTIKTKEGTPIHAHKRYSDFPFLCSHVALWPVYDCLIETKEGIPIHAHKRYNDFVVLETELLRTLPRASRPSFPELPPKAPLARYRAAFLARYRRALEHWLAAVLLHPDVGGARLYGAGP